MTLYWGRSTDDHAVTGQPLRDRSLTDITSELSDWLLIASRRDNPRYSLAPWVYEDAIRSVIPELQAELGAALDR